MPFGSVVNAAHTDPQYVPTSMGVIGTLGTSDVSGSALTLPFAVDAATGAAWGKEIGTPVFILAGGTLNLGTTVSSGGTNINIVTGSLVGTVVNNGGSVQLAPKPAVAILSTGTSGTFAIGTLVAAPGVGTSIYVTGFIVDGDTSLAGTTETCLSFGTVQTGSGVLFRATMSNIMPPAIGNYMYPVNAGLTNTPLTYLIISGAGSVSWAVTYFVQ